MAVYIYQLMDWPRFIWNHERLSKLSIRVSHHQGRLLGRMERMDPRLQAEAILRMLTLEVIHSGETEGDAAPYQEVRSAIAQHLGMEIADGVPSTPAVERMVGMMLDATQHYQAPLTEERLFDWHKALFPTGFSGARRILTGAWRENLVIDPLQVVSGPTSRQTVRYQAPHSYTLRREMAAFLEWFKTTGNLDPLIAAAIAHLWFITIQPFEDGNGRITRTITTMQLARSDDSAQRFYSMSAQIRKERNAYHDILEKTQAGSLDITDWLEWFLQCLDRAILETDQLLTDILGKARFWEKTAGMSLNDRQKKMLSHLLEGPEEKLTSSLWAKVTQSSPDTAVRDINDLLHKGVLIKKAAGGRSTCYALAS